MHGSRFLFCFPALLALMILYDRLRRGPARF